MLHECQPIWLWIHSSGAADILRAGAIEAGDSGIGAIQVTRIIKQTVTGIPSDKRRA